MLRIPLALKLSTNLAFSLIGMVLLAIAVLHAGKTLLTIGAPLPSSSGTPVNPVEQTITKALDLVTSQTSSP